MISQKLRSRRAINIILVQIRICILSYNIYFVNRKIKVLGHFNQKSPVFLSHFISIYSSEILLHTPFCQIPSKIFSYVKIIFLQKLFSKGFYPF